MNDVNEEHDKSPIQNQKTLINGVEVHDIEDQKVNEQDEVNKSIELITFKNKIVPLPGEEGINKRVILGYRHNRHERSNLKHMEK